MAHFVPVNLKEIWWRKTTLVCNQRSTTEMLFFSIRDTLTPLHCNVKMTVLPPARKSDTCKCLCHLISEALKMFQTLNVQRRGNQKGRWGIMSESKILCPHSLIHFSWMCNEWYHTRESERFMVCYCGVKKEGESENARKEYTQGLFPLFNCNKRQYDVNNHLERHQVHSGWERIMYTLVHVMCGEPYLISDKCDMCWFFI